VAGKIAVNAALPTRKIAFSRIRRRKIGFSASFRRYFPQGEGFLQIAVFWIGRFQASPGSDRPPIPGFRSPFICIIQYYLVEKEFYSNYCFNKILVV